MALKVDKKVAKNRAKVDKNAKKEQSEVRDSRFFILNFIFLL